VLFFLKNFQYNTKPITNKTANTTAPIKIQNQNANFPF